METIINLMIIIAVAIIVTGVLYLYKLVIVEEITEKIKLDFCVILNDTIDETIVKTIEPLCNKSNLDSEIIVLTDELQEYRSRVERLEIENIRLKSERTLYTIDTTCKGSWSLGTACGHCTKCEQTKPDDGSIID